MVDAVSLPADSIEHGSFVDEISDATIAEMKAKGISYDPTLSVVEGFTSFARGDTSLIKRSLVQQVTKRDLLEGTEKASTKKDLDGLREGLKRYPMSLEIGSKNLLKVWRAGIPLVTGSDAGNFLVLTDRRFSVRSSFGWLPEFPLKWHCRQPRAMRRNC